MVLMLVGCRVFEVRVCEVCGGEYVPKAPNQKYCSGECRASLRRENRDFKPISGSDLEVIRRITLRNTVIANREILLYVDKNGAFPSGVAGLIRKRLLGSGLVLGSVFKRELSSECKKLLEVCMF